MEIKEAQDYLRLIDYNYRKEGYNLDIKLQKCIKEYIILYNIEDTDVELYNKIKIEFKKRNLPNIIKIKNIEKELKTKNLDITSDIEYFKYMKEKGEI